jgi:hypothetical protein
MRRRTPLLALATVLGLTSLVGLVATADASSPSRATVTVKSTELFTFNDDHIKESSGLETSQHWRNIIYTHNDSGDDARFFAVNLRGQTKAVYTLNGAGSWDWEDMSQGPNDTLWFGDIGANQLGRDSIAVYKVKEPQKLRSRTIAWTRYDFRYDDDQSHNAEALLVNPVTGALFVVTKADSGAGVYRSTMPLRTSGLNTLKRVAAAPVKVTGGDFSPNGKRLVLRTYGSAYFYRKIGGHATVIKMPSAGESIAFHRWGPGVVVGKEGVHSPVWRVTWSKD